MPDNTPALVPPDSARDLITRYKARLKSGGESLRAAYEARPLTEPILKGRSQLVDGVLVEIWKRISACPSAALVAVGGYGREELFPGSDVDLLFLLESPPTPNSASA
jgi:[protein-PII] uridylyltransferase